jgi:hypothetical protein
MVIVLPGFSWDFRDFHKIFGIFIGFSGFSWDFKDFMDFRDFKDFHWIFMDLGSLKSAVSPLLRTHSKN